MSTTTKKRIIIYAIIFTFALALIAFGIFGCDMSIESANAGTREKVLTATQISKVAYNGVNYVSSSEDIDVIFAAFSFKLDGDNVVVNSQNATIFGVSEIYRPGTYYINVSANIEGVNYIVENVEFVLSKRTVTVTALLNGQKSLTITEGTPVSVAYNYSNAITSDTMQETIGGVNVTTLKNRVLIRPAFVEFVPDEVTANFTVVADYADSYYYDFVYEASVITILANTVPSMTQSSGDTILVSLSGAFSITYSLEFADIGISASSPDYAAVVAKMDVSYQNSDILSSYECIGCYEVTVKKGETIPTAQVPANVKILTRDTERGHSKYKVVAFYNNGETEVLNAKLDKDGYISFSAADMGTFVIISPIEGIGITTYVVVISIGVVVVLLIILMVALFRKKY